MRPYANSDFLLLLEFIVDRNLDHHEKEGKREKLLQVLFLVHPNHTTIAREC